MHLLNLLEIIDAFHRAPVTKRALFPTGAAPYQPLLMRERYVNLSITHIFRGLPMSESKRCHGRRCILLRTEPTLWDHGWNRSFRGAVLPTNASATGLAC